ncbi:MAG TPA: hypothetical protein VJB66_04880 [Candidatus Nanoarchaeia archaeon]|nr:hypothetical protein [Candidatus Nanoarchaeia archaeon]
MKNLKVLNTRDVKEIVKKLEELYDFSGELDYAFLEDAKHNIFIIGKDVSLIDFEQLHINSMGLYLGEINKYKEFRLSLEGSQLIGPFAHKNMFDINEEQVRAYFRGEDVSIDHENTGFALLHYKKDFFGAAKIKDGKLLNYLPKVHRTKELIL